MKRRDHASPTDSDAADGGPVRRVLLGGLCALAVANVLLPADSVASFQGSGLPVVLLTLLLAVAWIGAGLLRRELSVRFGGIDACVVALLLWHTLAAWLGRHGAPRPALNMLWQWLGLGVGYLLARQLLRSPRECRALLAIMLTLCMFETSFAFWSQVAVMPEARRQYERDKAAGATVRLPGTGIVMDESTRKQYEDRLYSPEPLGSFALTNSLAGLLAPWLVVGIGVVWTVVRQRPLPWRVLVPLAFGLAVLAACLYLTHSRTAQIAAVAGVLILCSTHGGQRLPRRVGWLCGGILLLLVVIGGAVLLINLPWLADARRSLVIRLEYWRSSWDIVREHFWLGCGAGNFRDQYLLHMLPQASETVADPHNFLWELWATAGTPAVVALLAALGGFFWQVGRATPRFAAGAIEGEPDGRPAAKQRDDGPGGPLVMMLGAAAGLAVAYLFGPLSMVTYREEVVVLGGVAGAIVLWLLWPWIAAGQCSALLPAIGAVVLLINLLSAGGISYPGVASSLWLLVAVGLCLAAPRAPERTAPFWGTCSMLLAAIVLAAACEWTGLNPVMRAQRILDIAGESRDPRALAQRQQMLRDAIAADPLVDEPRRELAETNWLLWFNAPSAERLAEFESSRRQWLELVPDSASAARLSGDWYLAMYRQESGQDNRSGRALLDAAVSAYRRASLLYPNSNIILSELAWAEHLAGQNQLATRDAQRALELDRLVRDPEHQFSGGLLRIADPDSDRRPPAELMREILSGGERSKN